MRAKIINENIVKEYSIIFYYADHPSIEPSYVVDLVEHLLILSKK